MRKPQTHIRVDFSDSCSIGPGKVALLEKIDQAGSLSAAARELKMSYRRAWLLIHSVNSGFSEPVAKLSAGGVEGGGARLTNFGRRLVAEYRDLQNRVDALTQKTFTGVRPTQASVIEPALPRRAISRSLKSSKRSS
jgi:molybdate transport system regulatory protein